MCGSRLILAFSGTTFTHEFFQIFTLHAPSIHVQVRDEAVFFRLFIGAPELIGIQLVEIDRCVPGRSGAIQFCTDALDVP